jgi:hypothetical protein
MTCRRQIMYGSFGYSFDKASCSKNCTCKSLVKSDTNYYDLEDVSIQTRADKDELNLNKWEVEFLYQKILAEAKQLSLPRRETLSRKTIQVSVDYIMILINQLFISIHCRKSSKDAPHLYKRWLRYVE